MARIVLNRTITLNFTADEMKKYDLKDPSLTLEAGKPVEVHDELVDHWMVKGVTQGEALKDDADPETAPANDTALTAALAQAQSDLATSREETAAALKDVAGAKAAFDEVAGKLNDANKAIDGRDNQILDLQSQLSSAKAAGNVAAGQVAELQGVLAAAQTENEGLRADLATAKAAYDALNAPKQANEGETPAAQ